MVLSTYDVVTSSFSAGGIVAYEGADSGGIECSVFSGENFGDHSGETIRISKIWRSNTPPNQISALRAEGHSLGGGLDPQDLGIKTHSLRGRSD